MSAQVQVNGWQGRLGAGVLTGECVVRRMEAGEVEPSTRVAGQGLAPCCDEIVTGFLSGYIPRKALDIV